MKSEERKSTPASPCCALGLGALAAGGDEPPSGGGVTLLPADVRCYPSDMCRKELLSALEQFDELEDVSTDTGAGSDSCTSVATPGVQATADELAPLEVEPWGAYEEFVMECKRMKWFTK